MFFVDVKVGIAPEKMCHSEQETRFVARRGARRDRRADQRVNIVKVL